MERTHWEINEIKELLNKDDKLVERAILIIFKFQTINEQECNQTNQNNGVGFNRFDGEIMSSFAKQIKNGKHLSEKQMAVARKKILKYAKQLTNVANEKLQEKYLQQSLI